MLCPCKANTFWNWAQALCFMQFESKGIENLDPWLPFSTLKSRKTWPHSSVSRVKLGSGTSTDIILHDITDLAASRRPKSPPDDIDPSFQYYIPLSSIKGHLPFSHGTEFEDEEVQKIALPFLQDPTQLQWSSMNILTWHLHWVDKSFVVQLILLTLPEIFTVHQISFFNNREPSNELFRRFAAVWSVLRKKFSRLYWAWKGLNWALRLEPATWRNGIARCRSLKQYVELHSWKALYADTNTFGSEVTLWSFTINTFFNERSFCLMNNCGIS